MFETITGCRACGGGELVEVLAFGDMPHSDGLLTEAQLAEPEPKFPLTLAFCPACSLVQILETVDPAFLFGADYPYFSSFSDAWLRHCRENVLELIERVAKVRMFKFTNEQDPRSPDRFFLHALHTLQRSAGATDGGIAVTNDLVDCGCIVRRANRRQKILIVNNSTQAGQDSQMLVIARRADQKENISKAAAATEVDSTGGDAQRQYGLGKNRRHWTPRM